MYPENATHLHIEPTTDCNSACPQCSRNICGSKHNPSNFQLQHLGADILYLLKLDSIKTVLINGNYGDIIMHPAPLDFMKTAREVFPDAVLQINTNGAALSPNIWKQFAEIGIEIEFGIDGITQESHSKYRRNTMLHRVLENAKAFIDAGGKAFWAMTVFKHNEDEVEDAKKLSNDMGFDRFTARPSTRFHNGTPTPIIDDNFNVVDWLYPAMANPPADFDPNKEKLIVERRLGRAFSKNMIRLRNIDASPEVDNTVTCWAEKNRSIYVGASGQVYPCCWLGRFELWDSVCRQFDLDPNFNKLQTGQTLTQILKSDFWQKLSYTITDGKPMKPCVMACGAKSTFNEQVEHSEVIQNG